MKPGFQRTTSSCIKHDRELENKSLQKQARIWLKSLLNEEFEECVPLSKLLADGHILFRISTTIQARLQNQSPGTCVDASVKHASPHSNVINFIELCQNLEIDKEDCLVVSDVIEEKNIHRVCVCLKALAEKAQHLNVPEFNKSFSSTPNENKVPDNDNVDRLQDACTSTSSENEVPKLLKAIKTEALKMRNLLTHHLNSNETATIINNETANSQNEVSTQTANRTITAETNENEDSKNKVPDVNETETAKCNEAEIQTSNKGNLSNKDVREDERKAHMPAVAWVWFLITSVALIGIISKREPSAYIHLKVTINKKK